ncbi:AmmeMemoRadiSam system protein B [Patescibacteria group bacterium]|nr:AmmeMemoRadiSam system protein B [Patescibacteria group bacterium]MBU1721461.1 AmmeMemoRadiSam system protein B [Patescibacteria group bacterium]MBU1900782.1 AmmeMemoRadiSam system protein B [Patescibacteria group bacterium]
MPLVFAGITPHTPLLIPSIGKEKAQQDLEKTINGLAQLEEELYVSKAEIIFIISPHQKQLSNTFVINGAKEYHASYEQFGDLSTKHEWPGAPLMVEALIRHLKNSATPAIINADRTLDHGASVPLSFLTTHTPDIPIIPMGFSHLSPKMHIQFGQALQAFIQERPERIAVIASGDLSHCLTKQSPAPFDKEGALFDKRLMQLLDTKNTMGVATMNTEMLKAAQECGYRSILILLGVLSEMHYTCTRYSYEYPFGVGYLVANCAL